jgi:hypothetical protein
MLRETRLLAGFLALAFAAFFTPFGCLTDTDPPPIDNGVPNLSPALGSGAGQGSASTSTSTASGNAIPSSCSCLAAASISGSECAGCFVSAILPGGGCQGEYDGCVNGLGGCNLIVDCVQNCGQEDHDCIRGCILPTDADIAHQSYAALLQCLCTGDRGCAAECLYKETVECTEAPTGSGGGGGGTGGAGGAGP